MGITWKFFRGGPESLIVAQVLYPSMISLNLLSTFKADFGGLLRSLYHNDRVAQAKGAPFRSVMDTNLMTSLAQLAVAY